MSQVRYVIRQSLTALFYPCKVANELADWSIQISPALGPPVSSPPHA